MASEGDDYILVDKKMMKRSSAFHYYECLKENVDKMIAKSEEYQTARGKKYLEDLQKRVETYRKALKIE